jgi:hypothetical protein
MYRLSHLYMIQKRYDETEEEFTSEIEVGRRMLHGKEHPLTLRDINVSPCCVQSKSNTMRPRGFLMRH